MTCLEILCWSAGLLFCWRVILPFMYMLFLYTIGKKLYSKRKQLKNAGEWAIVTGATGGIGEVYARELAKDGLNIMLISIDEAGLKRMEDELKRDFHVDTKAIACDFTQTDIYEGLECEINKLPSIACLVNNVGMGYPHIERFADASFIDSTFVRNLINCNLNSMANLTRIVLPILLKQDTTGSAIINLSSLSGLIPYPYMSFYGASKAFIQHFIRALIHEVKDSNVIIQAVCPGLVTTPLSGIKRPSYFVPTPGQFVPSALDMLGVESITMGYFPHALLGFLLFMFPKLAIWRVEKAYKNLKRRKSE